MTRLLRVPRLVVAGLGVAVFLVPGCISVLSLNTSWLLAENLRIIVQGTSGAECFGKTNGCGPGGALSVLVPECPWQVACFTSACDEHDLCYVTCGIDRDLCDQQFAANLMAICDERYGEDDPRRGPCITAAYIYAEVVARFGESFFEQGQVACGCEWRTAGVGPREFTFDAPFVDEDDDLLPDDWEIEVGLDPTNPNDSLSDPDGDGWLNLQEFLLNLDPFVPNS
jgi:hypothetical protein